MGQGNTDDFFGIGLMFSHRCLIVCHYVRHNAHKQVRSSDLHRLWRLFNQLSTYTL